MSFHHSIDSRCDMAWCLTPVRKHRIELLRGGKVVERCQTFLRVDVVPELVNIFSTKRLSPDRHDRIL